MTIGAPRKSRFVAGSAVALAMMLLSSCKPESKPLEADNASVRVVAATYVDHSQTVKLTGEVVAHVTTDLSFRTSGQILQWMVDVGAHVSAGQLLARIDPQEQEADVEAQQAAVRSAQAQVRQATAAFERQKALLSKGSTTQETFDQAQTGLSTAQGSLESAKAQLGTVRDSLSYTDLKADADGIVTVRNAETGQVVQAAQTMFTVARDGPRDAIFNVYESLLFIKPSDPKIELALVTDPTVTTTGEVSEISPTIDSSTGTVRVKIAMDQTPDRMTLGSAVTGVAGGPPTKLVVLPWTALTDLKGGPAIWVVDPANDMVSLKPVTVNSYETGRVLISAGVDPGEMLVVAGGKLLRPGQKVSVLKEQAQ